MLGFGSRRAIPAACVLAVVAFGALLRLDAFVQKYGPLNRPSWARTVTHRLAPAARLVRPAAFAWRSETRPYLGGDPVNYLRYAREMTTFYQPHVREPVFLALTRASLWLVDDQDQGLSLASAIGSTFVVLCTYLLGAQLRSRTLGLLAALVVAGEYELITWAPDGWRDDTFAATVAGAAWACLRVRRAPTFANALLFGGAAGVACLTRITAVALVVPALVWMIGDAPRAARRSLTRAVCLAAGIAAAIVGPYLLSCAIATGDPLYAINYHTGYYRFGEGLPSEQPMTAAAYLGSKLAAHPFAALDTAATGVLVQPFVTKWHGIDPWLPGLGPALFWLAALGLVLLLFVSEGRLLLVVLLGSLVPYAFTWNVAGGGEWRFTMPAYPFYLVAAFYAAARLVGGIRTGWRHRRALSDVVPWAGLRPAALTVAVLANLASAYVWLPWLVVREAIARGEDASVEAGGRDFAFFADGWSAAHLENISVRVSREPRATVRIPLPERRPYDLVLRLDPVAPERQERVTVLLNRHLLAHLRLAWNPGRVGSYRLRLPAHDVVAGANELTIVPETTVAAGTAGSRFAWLPPGAAIGVRLWHVRVLGR